ncbi:LuxR C-terminal-related transcriptional regulator [Methylobacterium sp. OAE515]|uniref:response regulator transcription factor n=1 Tax=Methylobacterium sp. OAE515 TaxID=2817895 RepID=UPI00178B6BB7
MHEGTVHIVDDDPALRTALVRLCRSAGLVAVGHSGIASLISRQRSGPECILLDVQLGQHNGLEVQEALRSAGCRVPIIFLTGFGTIPLTVEAMRGGAADVLTKPVMDEVLLDAIDRALRADAAAISEAQTRDELARRHKTLTPRECDVMACAIGGLMNKQIAAELDISEVTAKVHKRRVMEKMQATSLIDLIRMADRLGIAPKRQR